jgi:hypothetical protein
MVLTSPLEAAVQENQIHVESCKGGNAGGRFDSGSGTMPSYLLRFHGRRSWRFLLLRP